MGPPVALDLAASSASDNGWKSPALVLAGRASPFSQTTASTSIFQILAARSRRVWMTCSVAFVTTRAAAKVTRLPPVSAANGMELVSPISACTLAIVDAQQLRGDVHHRGARAADVGMAGHDDDGAVLVDVDLRARIRRRR